MFFLKRYEIKSFEMGLYFRDGEFRGLLAPVLTGSSTRGRRSPWKSSPGVRRSWRTTSST